MPDPKPQRGDYLTPLKRQQGDTCIKTHYTCRLGILPDPKPQRGDMFIEYQAT